MKNLKLLFVILIILLVFTLFAGPFYILEEGELSVVTRFGKIIKTENEAGLKMKMPFVDGVSKYTKKIQSWDGEAQRFPTQENQLIWVDFTARWQIVDSKLFYESLGTIPQAHSRLDDVINSCARDIIAQNLLRESVRNSDLINQIERKDVYSISSNEDESNEETANISTFTKVKYAPIVKGREKLSKEMLAIARKTTDTYGIVLIDVIIRQIKYSDDITKNVYQQMIKERNQIARSFRSDGEGEKAKWQGKMEKELLAIRSEADKQAKELKAKADAIALDIRNKAYSQNPEFADFWMAMLQYPKLLPKMKKTFSTEFEFFKYLHRKDGK